MRDLARPYLSLEIWSLRRKKKPTVQNYILLTWWCMFGWIRDYKEWPVAVRFVTLPMTITGTNWQVVHLTPSRYKNRMIS